MNCEWVSLSSLWFTYFAKHLSAVTRKVVDKCLLIITQCSQLLYSGVQATNITKAPTEIRNEILLIVLIFLNYTFNACKIKQDIHWIVKCYYHHSLILVSVLYVMFCTLFVLHLFTLPFVGLRPCVLLLQFWCYPAAGNGQTFNKGISVTSGKILGALFRML